MPSSTVKVSAGGGGKLSAQLRTYHYAPEFLPRGGQRFQWFIYSAAKFLVGGKRKIPFGSVFQRPDTAPM